MRGRQFIESEAELSGDNDSGDEADDTQDHYDQSFVDDCTQATDHARRVSGRTAPAISQRAREGAAASATAAAAAVAAEATWSSSSGTAAAAAPT